MAFGIACLSVSFLFVAICGLALAFGLRQLNRRLSVVEHILIGEDSLDEYQAERAKFWSDHERDAAARRSGEHDHG